MATITGGGYIALTFVVAVRHGRRRSAGLTFGWPLIVAAARAPGRADRRLSLARSTRSIFGRLRRRGASRITPDHGLASASPLVLRNLVVAVFGPGPELLHASTSSRRCRSAGHPHHARPDLSWSASPRRWSSALHLFLTRTQLGRAMRAVAREPVSCAASRGIDVDGRDPLDLGRSAPRWPRSAASCSASRSSCAPSSASTCCCRCSPPRSSAASAASTAPCSAALLIGITESLSVLVIGPEYRQAISFLAADPHAAGAPAGHSRREGRAA